MQTKSRSQASSGQLAITDLLLGIGRYLNDIWRYRWRALMIAWVVCLLGWAFVHRIPDQYESHARVHVNTESMLRPLLRDLTVEKNLLSTAMVINQALLSRPNLENMVRTTGLDARATNQRELELLLRKLSEEIDLRESNQADIYTITYRDHDPEIAQRVVQSLLTGFVERTLGDERSDTVSAQDFIDKRIAEYKARLEKSERELKEFKQHNVGLMPSEGQDYYQRLQAATEEFEEAKLALREAVIRSEELSNQLQGVVPTFGMLSRPTESKEIKVVRERIQTRRTELDSLLLNYTDEHPDVRALQHTIKLMEADLEKLSDEQQAILPEPGEPEKNPVYQQVKIALSKSESEAAALKVRVSEFRSRVNVLRKRIDTVPRVEAELAKLTRDYAVIKQNYDSLLVRKEQASLSEKAEKNADDLQFRVIDPPLLPIVPVWPNRPLLLAGVLLLGLGVGAGAAFLFAQIRPVFLTSRDLSVETGFPVLGAVSYVTTHSERLRKNLALTGYSFACLALLGMFGALVAVHMFNIDLTSYLSPLKREL